MGLKASYPGEIRRLKRRKKRRKVSVVQAAQDSDEDSPTFAPTHPLQRAKSLPVTVLDAKPSPAMPPARALDQDTRQPSAGPSTQVPRPPSPHREIIRMATTVCLTVLA